VAAAGQQPRPENGTIYGSAMLSYGSQLGKEGNNKTISNRNSAATTMTRPPPWDTMGHRLPSLNLLGVHTQRAASGASTSTSSAPLGDGGVPQGQAAAFLLDEGSVLIVTS